MGFESIMKLGLIISATDKTGGGINGVIGKLGKLAGAVGAYEIIGTASNAIMQFDDSIQSLSAVTGTSGTDLEVMKGSVMSLAKESKKSGYEIAKAFENVGSNMSEYLSDPKGLRQITSAGVTLAKAARMEVGPALDNLTTIMNEFDLKAGDAAKSVNILTAGEIVGNVRTAQISTALQEFGASASGANVNLGESVALIEVLGKKLKAEQIGVAGRNILLSLSAAKGMPKEALSYLEKYKVSTKLLMDPNQKLISRLKELSKISGDATAMVKVFGKENVTAATILLKNLPLYENWEGQIQNTNKAQLQADTNSKSFINRLGELKSAFENEAISQNESSGGLNALGGVLGFVTENMSTLINLIVTGIAIYATWWTWTKLITAATWLYTFAQDMQLLLQGYQGAMLLKGTAALGIYTLATNLASGAIWRMTTAFLANPLVWIPLLIMAVIGGLILLVKYWDEVTDAIVRFGQYLLRWVMQPIIFLLDTIGKLTGAKWAINLSTNMKDYQHTLDMRRADRNFENQKKEGAKALAEGSISGDSNQKNVYAPTINIQGSADANVLNKALGNNNADWNRFMTKVATNNARISTAQ